MTKVYIVERNYDYEGASTRGVFSTFEKANQFKTDIELGKIEHEYVADGISITEFELDKDYEKDQL